MMMKIILTSLVLVIAGLAIFVALQPSEYTIQRELVINAKPELIFPYLSGTRMNDLWMPWKDSDPQVKVTYSGPDDGVGSISTWESPGRMGYGKAEITEVVSLKKVIAEITYTKPMAFTQVSEFLLVPNGDNTTMRWTVTGNNAFIPRFMCLFMNMDKFIGGEFIKGMNKLKALVEVKK